MLWVGGGRKCVVSGSCGESEGKMMVATHDPFSVVSSLRKEGVPGQGRGESDECSADLAIKEKATW
ncbi:hypothetical protein AB0M32_16260 [Streptomyces sp. NPDC051985]|uniref:hypothetical protein n=1 Tax=Streptomyces sp. NPDC051985 TaxID=3155807 RepID=UPI003414B6C5